MEQIEISSAVPEVNVAEFIGKTFTAIERVGECILWQADNGDVYQMWHDYNGASGGLEDIAGDLKDLVGYPILKASQDTNEELRDEYDGWAFYNIATIMGYVTLRWYDGSSGRYSDIVNLKKQPARAEKTVQEIAFDEKVRSMSAKEITLAMVEGLRNPKCMVRMATFGDVADGICFGCAATNTIMQISGVTFDTSNIGEPESRAEAVKSTADFLYTFETAIDNLRLGNAVYYNYYAAKIGIATIPITADLPRLGNDYTEEELKQYEDFANTL